MAGPDLTPIRPHLDFRSLAMDFGFPDDRFVR
jgi:hypothetical protein